MKERKNIFLQVGKFLNCTSFSTADLKQYIPGCVLDPAQLQHELEAPESRYRLARAVLQEIPRQVRQVRHTDVFLVIEKLL